MFSVNAWRYIMRIDIKNNWFIIRTIKGCRVMTGLCEIKIRHSSSLSYWTFSSWTLINMCMTSAFMAFVLFPVVPDCCHSPSVYTQVPFTSLAPPFALAPALQWVRVELQYANIKFKRSQYFHEMVKCPTFSVWHIVYHLYVDYWFTFYSVMMFYFILMETVQQLPNVMVTLRTTSRPVYSICLIGTVSPHSSYGTLLLPWLESTGV